MVQEIQCRSCFKILPFTEIQLSHDVPKYAGGTDMDGRHSLCKKCHDIYERKAFAVMFRNAPKEIQDRMRDACKAFSKTYFYEWDSTHNR